jgi:DNA-binding NarL/FixJ family response regulator
VLGEVDRVAPSPVLRVVIGEDDVLLREGVARLLTDAGVEVVAQAGDAVDLVGKVLAYRPDVAIIDVRMPPKREYDGLVAAVELRRRAPRTAVLILSQFYEPSLALQLIGDHPEGVGYLLKERVGDVAAFVDCIHRVAGGGSALDPEVVARLLGRQLPNDPLQALSPAEHAVLAAMAEGKSNSGIARALIISEASVEKHVTALFRKLGIGPTTGEHRRVQAVLTYLRGTAGGR